MVVILEIKRLENCIKKTVKNEDLWRKLDEARKPHQVTWEWVKGHAGNEENERADLLARLGMAPFQN